MLEIHEASLRTSRAGHRLLDDVSVRFPPGHFAAIIGPSGCGKTTLLKLIAGIAPGEESGDVRWKGQSLHDKDFHASEIAYVPQFSIAHDDLTVQECVRFARSLRLSRRDRLRTKADETALLEIVGLREQAEQLVRTLSGGQRRRLSLAIELTSQPDLLLCDEVTSGLDPQSESDIVELLRHQAGTHGRLVLSVTHSLTHLEHYDSVLVLYEGKVVFHGRPELLAPYFGIPNAEQVYARLKDSPASSWAEWWLERRESVEQASGGWDGAETSPSTATTESERAVTLPSTVSQFLTLWIRRHLIMARSLPHLLLQCSLILGFPVLVAIFAWNGLPSLEHLKMGLNEDVFQSLTERRDFLEHSSEVGSVVSGIVMFQVILLTLMGANNSGREIAAERAIFEKERMAGLNPLAYVSSKAAYLLLFVLAQSVWMGIFVHFACRFPGDFPSQLLMLVLVNSAITAICLAVSSLMPTAEQASLVSIYLVGFQLPLSGAVLALPDMLGPFIRPLISAYWSWSGILQTLKQEPYYDVVQSVAQSPIAASALSIVVLVAHLVIGLIAAWIGCERRQQLL